MSFRDLHFSIMFLVWAGDRLRSRDEMIIILLCNIDSGGEQKNE